MELEIFKMELKTFKMELETFKMELKTFKMELKIFKMELKTFKMKLKTFKMELKTFKMLKTKNPMVFYRKSMQKVVCAVCKEVEISNNLLVFLLAKFHVRLRVTHL